MKHCDNCNREPEPFDVEDSDEQGYFFLVPKDSWDPAHLMSDLSFQFCICTDPNPVDQPDMEHWCVQCVAAINPNNEEI